MDRLWIPEKSEGPATVVEFLGLTLVAENMVIHIPMDKLQDTADIITKMVETVVPAGKSFIKCIFQA